MDILQDYFKEKGYNVVALPKSNIRPLGLLALENGNLSDLGSRVDVLFEEDSSPLPAVAKNVAIPDLQGQTVVSFRLSAGIGLLNGLLGSLGLGKAAANAKLSDSDKILFSFDGAAEDGIKGFLDLDNFISGAVPQVERFKTYSEKLKNSELYIITSVLKCNNFSIQVINKDSQDITTGIEIKEAASAHGELKRSKDSKILVSHTGKESLVFAFKAVQIIYDAPKWFQFWDKKQAQFKIKAQTGMVLKFENFPVKELDLGEGLVSMD
jgi:hypothetical protein